MKDTRPSAIAHSASLRCIHPSTPFRMCRECAAYIIRRERRALAKLARSQNLWGGDVIADAILARNKLPKGKP